LTQPASYDGSAFDLVDSSEKPTPGPTDPESNPSGLTTSSPEFKSQAIREASRFVNSDDPDVVGFAQLDPRDHRMNREKTPPKETEKVTIASVELMPPRHPPVPRYWDYLPPLRIVKIILDWFKTQKRLEDQDRTKGGKRRRGGNTVKSEITQEILSVQSIS
jgi:putative membrane protein